MMATTNSALQSSFNSASLGLYGTFYQKPIFQDMILGVQGENDGGIFHFMSPQKYQSDLHFTSFESARWIGRLKIDTAGPYLFSSSDIWRSCMKIWQNVTFDIQPDVLKLMKCTEDGDQKIYTIPEKTDPEAKDAFRVKCDQGKCQILKQENEEENWDVEIHVKDKAALSTTYSGTISYLMQQGDMSCHLETGIYKIRVEYMPLIPIAENENILVLYWQTPEDIKKWKGKKEGNKIIPAEHLRGPDFSDQDYFPAHITDNLFDSQQYGILDPEEISFLVPDTQQPGTATSESSSLIATDSNVADEYYTDVSVGDMDSTEIHKRLAQKSVENHLKLLSGGLKENADQIDLWKKARKEEPWLFVSVATLKQTLFGKDTNQYITELKVALQKLQGILKQVADPTQTKDLIQEITGYLTKLQESSILEEPLTSDLADFSSKVKNNSTLYKLAEVPDTVTDIQKTLADDKTLEEHITNGKKEGKDKWIATYVLNPDPTKNLDPDYDLTNPHALCADANRDGINNYDSTHGFTITSDGQTQPYGVKKDLPTYFCHYRLNSTTGDPFQDRKKLISTDSAERVYNISERARNPLVAAYPHITVKMVGYQLIPMITQTKTAGTTSSFSLSHSQVKTRTDGIVVTDGTDTGVHMEVSLSEKPSIGGGGSKHWSHSLSNEASVSSTQEVTNTRTKEETQSFQSSYNTAEYATFNGLVQYQNSGTAAVSQLAPSFNFNYADPSKDGQWEPLVTVRPAKDTGQVALLLQPDASYPPGDQDTPLVIKSTDTFNANQVHLSLDQANKIASGAPVNASFLQYEGYIPNVEPSINTQWMQLLDKMEQHTAYLTLFTPDGSRYDRRIAAPKWEDLGYKGIDPQRIDPLPLSYQDIDKAHRLTIREAIQLAFGDTPQDLVITHQGIKYDLQSQNVNIIMSRETKEDIAKQLAFAQKEVTDTEEHLVTLQKGFVTTINKEFQKLDIKMSQSDMDKWLENLQKLDRMADELQIIKQQKDSILNQINKEIGNRKDELKQKLKEINAKSDKLENESAECDEIITTPLTNTKPKMGEQQIEAWVETNITTPRKRMKETKKQGEAYLQEMTNTLQRLRKKEGIYDYELRQGMRLIIEIPPIVTATFEDKNTADKHTYQILYLKNHYLNDKLNYRIKLRPPSSPSAQRVQPNLQSFTTSQEKDLFGYKEGTLSVLDPKTDSSENKGQSTDIPHLSNEDRIEVWIKKEQETEKDYKLLIAKTVGQIPGFRPKKPELDADKLASQFKFRTFNAEWLSPKSCDKVELSIPSNDILKNFLSFTLEVQDPTTKNKTSYGPVLASEIIKQNLFMDNMSNPSCTFDFSLFQNFDMTKNYFGYTFTLKGKLDEAVPSGWEEQKINSSACPSNRKETEKCIEIVVPTFHEPREIELCSQIFPGKMFTLETYHKAFTGGILSDPIAQKSKVNGDHISFDQVYSAFKLNRFSSPELRDNPLLLAGIKKVTCTFKGTEETEIINPTGPQFITKDNTLHVDFNTKIDIRINEDPDWRIKLAAYLWYGAGGKEIIQAEDNKYHIYNAEVDGLVHSKNNNKSIQIQITVDKDILKNNDHEDQTITIFEQNF